jgi:metal-responsive CopG/Arc/MetJ family transcriptional regulator
MLDGERDMRTTVEIRDEYRARLLEIAAVRGEKGFSALVEEAVRRYLEEEDRRAEARRAAVAVHGTLTDGEADELEERVADIRRSWR